MTRALLLDELVTVALVALFALMLWNLRVVRVPRPRRWSSDAPLVSLLVPARDEEAVIGSCVQALLAQDYPNFEIIVLDDDSSDSTAAVVRARSDPRLRLIAGAPLPAGWTGKNWACHQLAQRARGSILCFVDADTLLEPDALGRAAGELCDHDLALVSMLLRTETDTVAEAVLMPMVNHAMLALLPAALVERPRARQVAVALGPFIMVTRTAYDAAGGHAADPSHLVDDVRLARAVKAGGGRIALRNGVTLVSTRWYTGFREIWNGFSKNAYGALDYNPVVALGALLVAVPVLLVPFLRLGVGVATGAAVAVPLVQVGMILAARVITSRAGRDPLWTVPLHPVAVAVWAGTLARSMMLTGTARQIEWKGRVYPAATTHERP